jgi:hypothetical protein
VGCCHYNGPKELRMVTDLLNTLAMLSNIEVLCFSLRLSGPGGLIKTKTTTYYEILPSSQPTHHEQRLQEHGSKTYYCVGQFLAKSRSHRRRDQQSGFTKYQSIYPAPSNASEREASNRAKCPDPTPKRPPRTHQGLWWW